MKRIFHHPTGPETGRTYWRSLGELENTPEFREALEREFPAGAQELETDDLSRRSFLRLMGASVALAGVGLTGCRRPELHALPYTNSPEWIVAGKSLQYATALPRRSGAIPLLVTSHEGRPTHLEGNTQFPNNTGGLDVLAQASILGLYDPDRTRAFKNKGEEVGVDKFAELIQGLAQDYGVKQGDGLAILTEPSTSPTRIRLQKELQKKFPKLLFATYDPFGNENRYEAAKIVLGQRASLQPLYSQADTILAIESDFSSGQEDGIGAIKGFASRRRVKSAGETMNRLYVVESRFTRTGAVADHRLRLPASAQISFLLAIIQQLVSLGVADLGSLIPPDFQPNLTDDQKKWAVEFAADFVKSTNPLVVVGRQQSVGLQAYALAINRALGALGKTIKVLTPLEEESSTIHQLSEAVKGGAVSTLITIGVNPVYATPSAWGWSELLTKIPQTIHLSHTEDETALLSQWTAPLAHYLESWGDGLAEDGTYVTAQPLILPLFGGVSELEVLAALNGNAEALKPLTYPKPSEIAAPSVPGKSNLPVPTGLTLVRETFTQLHPSSASETAWNKVLHDGYSANIQPSVLNIDFKSQSPGLFLHPGATQPVDKTKLEVTFYACSKVDDGRFANNGWLQELPDFTTKIAWDNAALISPATAKELGVKTGDLVVLETDAGSIEIVTSISPGQADGSIAVALGYGRTAAGQVGNHVGFNAYPLWPGPSTTYVTTGGLKKTGRTYLLATTQDHSLMEGRALVREATLDEYAKTPDFAKKMGVDGDGQEIASIYPNPYADPKEKGPAFLGPISQSPQQWGMVIDLSTCVACNACSIACQSENNIPIVGKEQVSKHRSMHWIRIDRYFSDSAEDPQIAAQPVLCQHCENAPCEAVCPVNATVHSPEGLNVIAYNRCIGTRYCMNNCPYKVRRFNFFDYNERDVLSKGPFGIPNLYLGPLGKEGSEPPLTLQRNPNVTVRVRGVVEKCSFCVQRIEDARADALIRAKDSANTLIPVDSFRTACQVGCPAEAIVFGDIANANSAVSKLRAMDREYSLLGYLNTRPRVTYLARLRNPNPRMPGSEKIGFGSDWDKVGPYSHEETGKS